MAEQSIQGRQVMQPDAILIAALIVLMLVGCTGDQGPLPPSADDVALNNRGVALMGSFDYAGAHEAFSLLVERHADWHDARVNLAIALMNRRQPDDEQRALEQLDTVLAARPRDARANFVAGLLHLYLGNVDVAARHFEVVLSVDSNDAYAHYYYGQCQQQLGNPDAALPAYQRAMQLDPYLRSAYYSAAQVLQRLDKKGEAENLLSSFARFANNPRARLAEFKYTRMGPKSLATVTGERPTDDRPPEIPDGPVFATPVAIAELSPMLHYGNLTTVDVNNDGDQELFVADGGSAGGRLLTADSAGGMRDYPLQPWQGVGNINAIAWGDVDNNGLVDAYLCRSGPDQLWMQIAPDQWQHVDAYADVNIDPDSRDCADALFVDADHDGDLDILIANRNAGNELLNNNRDGTFRSLSGQIGSAANRRQSRRVITADVDADRDVDLLFINDSPPHDLLINDRLWRYKPAEGMDDFINSALRAVAIVDFDSDGLAEFVGLTDSNELVAWTTGHDGSRRRVSLYRSDIATDGEVDLASMDLNGDGRWELLLLTAGLFEVVSVSDTLQTTHVAAARFDGGVPIPVLRDVTMGASLVAAGNNNGEAVVFEWAPGPGRFAFTSIALSGKHDEAETMRSNASGIGTQLSLRNGALWSVTDTYKNTSMRGHSLQPVSIGLRGQSRADFVALHWSDGVYQTELDLGPGVLHEIAETERQLSSCPVLFAWDGERYAFVTDLLGVAGIGGFVEPGVSGTPRPWERLVLPPNIALPLDGKLTFKLTEPMQENAYLDSAWLETYDLPEGWSLAVDERMSTGDPAVSGDVFFYRTSVAPITAIDSAEKDVTALVSRRDARAMTPGSIDRRFLGLLERTETLTLEFSEAIDAGRNSQRLPVLLADAWVEYPYSQTVFSAWQAGLQYRSVTLQARDAEGIWQVVYPEFGYPAGMPREMTLPLHALPAGTTALRLSWNRELYWDRIRVVYAEPPPPGMRSSRRSTTYARVAKTGFARRSTLAQRRPVYDYEDRATFWDTEYAAGFYTRLGEVTELLTQTDDALAVIGPGEEIHLEFDAQAATPSGSRRWHVLETRGWAKDKDLYTYQGDTVGPLPRAGDGTDSGRRDALHRRYNIRFQAGR